MPQPVSTPNWVKNAIFYQIFPDRFAKGSTTIHPPHLKFKPWGSPPEEQGYQGGDLYGIVEKLDYLQSLGINALYLNPIFSSAANHRYHTFDYYTVDPLLGGNGALRLLLDEAHARSMKVVLDGVFNHASRGFWQFHHILENGGNSPYIDWFTVHDWPLRPYPEDDKPINYNAWWNLAALPKFNFNNPDVQDYFLDVARHWLAFGIDGWRLDVGNEIEDHTFWQRFREVVKSVNPEAYIVGEVWVEAQPWLQGDQWDATMNYIMAWSVMSFAGNRSLRPGYHRDLMNLSAIDASAYAKVLAHMLGLYDPEIVYAQLNMLDSHDTARALWVLQEDKTALRLAFLLYMTLPGAPCIYYGTEIGMTGGDDPGCRAAFPWEQPETWDQGLFAYYRQAIALRNTQPVLRTGDYELVYAEDMHLIFRRKDQQNEVLVYINAGTEAASFDMPEGHWQQIWPETLETGERVVVPEMTGVVLLKRT
ncbi:MAG TPA: alpha-amylase [Bacteroidetes bacterium]|nr:alpha-amylase [Bacteroidota bacterium]HRR07343.1 glycoside hydrolase family 13 protein [Rhodothermales bacterium]